MSFLGEKKENSIARIACSAVLVLFAFFCAFLHFRRIAFNVFWVDTAFSVDLIRLPFTDMLRATSVNEHPPFYYLFGKAVMLILGDHPYAFRASAFIPYIGILALALTFVRKNFGLAPAYIIVGFSSFTPKSIVYVMETRMYELGCFLVLVSFISMYLIFTRDDRRRNLYWALFFISSIMTAYTHYYLTVAVCVMYLSVIIYCIRYKTDLKKCLFFSIAAIVSYLPWIGVMFRNFGVRSEGWWAQGYSHFDETMREIFGFKRFYFPALFLILVMIMIYIAGIRKNKKGSDKAGLLAKELFFLFSGILVIAVTFLTGAIVSVVVRPMFLSRFIYPMASIGWLVFGIAIEVAADRSGKTGDLRVLLSAVPAALLSIWLVQSCFGIYREDRAFQAVASDRTNAFLAEVSIPCGEVIYSDFEQEEFTIAGCYFPGTDVKIQNAMFYYDIPEEESFYLVWKESEAKQTTENLVSYGYDVTRIASGGTLGAQGDVCVLLCKKC